MAVPSPGDVRAQVLALLLAIPDLGGRVHDGTVPDDIEHDENGYVLPYVVLFSSVPNDLSEERDLTHDASMEVLNMVLQTQCVGATSGISLDVAHDVRKHLLNAPIGRGWLRPDDSSFSVPEPIRDPDTTPSRHFMPLRWRLLTT